MSIKGNVENEVVDIHGSISLVLKGDDGESAYEVAVRNGFVGTEAEWLASLKGEASKAEAATAEALMWRNSAKDYATEAGNHEETAKGYRNGCQTIQESIAPQVTQAITAIQAEKAEAEAKKALVDEAAAQAHLDRVQADADAAEVRYLHGETVEQKNIATDAAERARRYAAREFKWEDLNERPTTRDDFPILDVPKVDGTDATGTWDIDITGDAKTVNGHTVAKNVPANAVFTDTTYSEATTSQAGLLSATDKAKLNGIESGAQANTITGVKGGAESSYRVGDVNITKANIGLGNVDNTADIDKSVASAQTANNVAWSGVTNKPTTLEGYGITNAPTKTGTGASGTWGIDINGNAETVNGLTVETAVPANAKFTDTTYDVMTSSELSDGTSTQGKLIDAHTLATFILTVAADVVNNAPEALDTLAELAQALGNDPNFATTVMNEIGKKLDKSGGVITGNLTVNGTLTGNISGSASTVNGHTVESDVPANAKFTDTTYSNATTSTAGLMSSADKTKLNGIESGAQVNTITGVKGNSESNYRTGNVNITKANIGLGNVDNTADSAKSVAYATTAGDASTVSGFTVGKAVPSDAEFTDTTYSNFVKSGSTAKAGLVPAPSTTAGTTHYLREDGTWTVPPNTTYSNFVKSGSGAKAGLVPAPSTTAGTTKYLREDGTWQVPPDNNTTYTAASAAPLANGTAAVGTSAKYAREDHVHPLQTSVSGSSGSCTGNAATATRQVCNVDDGRYADVVNATEDGTKRIGTIRITNENGRNVMLLGVHNENNSPPDGLNVINTNGVISAYLPGTFTAKNFVGALNGNAATATKATYDENGVRISTSYAPQAQIDYLANVATNSVSAAVSAKNDAVAAKNQAQQIADGLVSIRDTAVDTSLAISGQAADSKTVGDKFAVIGATSATNNEYLCVWLDSANRVLFGVKADGSFYWQKGIPKVLKDELDAIKARLSALEG